MRERSVIGAHARSAPASRSLGDVGAAHIVWCERGYASCRCPIAQDNRHPSSASRRSPAQPPPLVGVRALSTPTSLRACCHPCRRTATSRVFSEDFAEDAPRVCALLVGLAHVKRAG